MTNYSIALTEGAPSASAKQQQNHYKGHRQEDQAYVIYADDLEIQPAYENSVNPFLSHIEQAPWGLKRINDLNLRRRVQGEKVTLENWLDESFTSEEEEAFKVDPSKPHFIDDSDDYGNEQLKDGEREVFSLSNNGDDL